MNRITKKTLRYGRIRQISFTFVFISLMIFLISLSSDDKGFWILPFTLMLCSIYALIDSSIYIKRQKDHAIELRYFITQMKPLIGLAYQTIIDDFGFESETDFQPNRDRFIVRKWFALGYTFIATFDLNDLIVDYKEINDLSELK